VVFDWADFLLLAESLAFYENDEAAQRSVISRAYYAAIGMARHGLEERGIVVPSGSGAHHFVWAHFHQIPDVRARRNADRGRRRSRRRNCADYADEYDTFNREAIDAIWLARQILEDLAAVAMSSSLSSPEVAYWHVQWSRRS
jgi:uncharacterized protein (UPF0332 family)